MFNKKTILVTGSSGFIGSNLMKRLLLEAKDCTLIGYDNNNDYYDVSLKEYRLKELNAIKTTNTYKFFKGDLANKPYLESLFKEYKFDIVVNLAAQAGVRYSITNPDAYINSNIIGFYNILELCRNYPLYHLC